MTGIPLHQPRLPAGLPGREQDRARAAGRAQHDVARFARITDRALDQGHRPHGQLQVILRRLVEGPHVALLTRPAPGMLAIIALPAGDRLVLRLVGGPAEREDSAVAPEWTQCTKEDRWRSRKACSAAS